MLFLPSVRCGSLPYQLTRSGIAAVPGGLQAILKLRLMDGQSYNDFAR
jgi:hypothetical protein